jgi:hypothetical protein
MTLVKLFKEVLKSDLDIVGHKGLNLSILANEGFNVPPGFVITTEVMEKFFSETKLNEKIKEILSKLTEENAEKISVEIKKLILNTDIPRNLEEEIVEAYESLGFELNKLKIADLLSIKNSPLVAVRSSYTKKIDEELIDNSAVLNVKGKNNLLSSIKQCWASLYECNLLVYRLKNNISHNVFDAIAVQKMIDAEVSGISFSSNPESKLKSEILIKACFGFGKAMKKVTPDKYVVDKKDLSVKDIQVNEQGFCLIMDHAKGVNVKKDLREKGKMQKLNTKLISEVARLTKRISEQLENEQKIEWCMFKNNIYILQSKDLDMDFEDEKMEPKKEEIEEERKEETTIDIYTPNLEDDLKVLDEMEDSEKDDEGLPLETDEKIKETEEERKEEDVIEFVDKIEEEKQEPVEEEIPSIDDIEEVKEEPIKPKEPKINSTGMPSFFEDQDESEEKEDIEEEKDEPEEKDNIKEEKQETSFDLIKDLTRKMEQQFNDDDIEGYEETRKELRRTLDEL